MNPKVSIVITTFNGSAYLREAIESALAQTYPNVEILVVDDGSDDGGRTVEIAQSYGDRVRTLRKENGGVSTALNLGIREMHGDYFSWLCHDDVYYPRKLERQVEAARVHGPDVIIYSDYELVDPALGFIKKKVLPDMSGSQVQHRLLFDSTPHAGTLLIPRGCFDKHMFDERLLTTQDYDMWFRLSQDYRFVRVPEVLLKYRIHPGQDSWTNGRCIPEGNRLLIGFLNQVSAEALQAGTTEPLSRVYLRAAIRIKLRGFFAAADHALDLAERHRRQRFSPLHLAMRVLYRAASPRLRPMFLWRRFWFAMGPHSAA